MVNGNAKTLYAISLYNRVIIFRVQALMPSARNWGRGSGAVYWKGVKGDVYWGGGNRGRVLGAGNNAQAQPSAVFR